MPIHSSRCTRLCARSCLLLIRAHFGLRKPTASHLIGPMIISWTSSSPFLLLWLAGVLSVSAPQHSHRTKADAHATGLRLLRRVLLQEERVPFEADQQVLVSSESDGD